MAVWKSGPEPCLPHHNHTRDTLHLAEQPCAWEGAVSVVTNVQYNLISRREKAISRSSGEEIEITHYSTYCLAQKSCSIGFLTRNPYLPCSSKTISFQPILER